MSNVWYRIHLNGENPLYATHVANSPADVNRQQRGDRSTFSFNVGYLEDLSIGSGSTYTIPSGHVEVYDNVTNDGTIDIDGRLVFYGTFTNNGTIDDSDGALESRAEERPNLIDYSQHAGSFSTTTSLNNTVRFREQFPSDAAINSLVVGIEPSTDLQNRNISGVWGLINGIQDDRNSALSNNRYIVDVTILSEFADYDSTTEVINDLG